MLLIVPAFSAFSQIDSTRADSLIMVNLMQPVLIDAAKEEKTDTVTEIPDDPELFDYYCNKGITYDIECSQLALYREVYAWMGVRYKYAGLTKRGVDCAGFVKNICNNVYGSELSGSAGNHYKKCVPIERTDLEEGDLVFFKINKSYISHVGIYIGNNKFAHAAVHGGVTISDLNSAYYNKYYYGSGRLLNAPNKREYGR
jgi:lipoprotein Spr